MLACAWNGVVYVALTRVTACPSAASTSPLVVATRSVAGSLSKRLVQRLHRGQRWPLAPGDAQITSGANRHLLAFRYHGDEVVQAHDTRVTDSARPRSPASRRGAAVARAARAASGQPQVLDV